MKKKVRKDSSTLRVELYTREREREFDRKEAELAEVVPEREAARRLAAVGGSAADAAVPPRGRPRVRRTPERAR